jgi:uncharacterized damage-inducible protein DinB
MNIQDIHFIFEYNYWANGKILSACKNITQEQYLAPADYPFGGLGGTLLHVVDAERVWRVLFETSDAGEYQELKAEDFPNFESLENQFREEEKLMRAYLSKLKDDDMESHLKYTVEGGIQRDRILWHCFYHLINHGTQHRAEAAALLTSYSASPGDLDVTVFLNEKNEKIF